MRTARRVLLGLILLVVLLAGGAYAFLRGSLPVLDGTRSLAGLGADVTVERDSLGVVKITAATKADALRALGFVHAQDRFFGMDLLRRAAAGELAALLGRDLVGADSTLRVHRFRAHAAAALAALPDSHRALVRAYTDGVNAGLGGLSARPFEYAVLRQTPEPWREEDAFLVAAAMFLDLQRDGLPDELETAAERAALPNALARFFDPLGDRWDAPLEGDTLASPPLPPADSLAGYRPGPLDPGGRPGETYASNGLPGDLAAGSNNGAVSGARSATGAAMVADDMHLGLRLPNIWYRAELNVGDDRIGGVTLPGVPGVIVGSTRHIAWGFTNSYGDFIDLVELVPGSAPGLVRTDSGEVRLDTLRETIRVAGGDSVRLDLVQSPWGPVLYRSDSSAYAVQWSAYLPGALNLGLVDLWNARTRDDAFAVAHRTGVPAQNFVVGDRDGRVGWTIIGRLPNRTGRNGQTPVRSTDPNARWNGWRDPSEIPTVVDPSDGVVWTANNRVVSGDDLRTLGLGPYAHGARAQQIRDNLRRHAGPFAEADLLAVYLDDRALVLDRWQRLLLDLYDGAASNASLRDRLAAWNGRASVDSRAYGVVHCFRNRFAGHLTPALLAPVRARYPDADDLSESALWTIATEKPAALLPPGAASWDDLMLGLAEACARDVPPTWGEANRVAIAHPMADALPLVGRFLRMPPDPQAGDGRMPRVARPDFGASERMAVSPGFEDRGILHMPGGNAGHPLSPYWGAGHDAWVEGRPLPFRPGRARWTLRLTP